MSGVPRSQRLIAFTSTGPGISAVWQSPEGYVTLVKSAAAECTASLATNIDLIAHFPDDDVTIRLATWTLQPTEVAQWQGWFALNPLDQVYFSVWGEGVHVVLFGAVLSGANQFPPAARRLPRLEPHS
jgi:hypothetical protein